ncbi:hypothetical protein ATANTOWER_030597, partial [Ataeniobius toweri]|nr:hypothetical protein [Ataeniobius toweri]
NYLPFFQLGGSCRSHLLPCLLIARWTDNLSRVNPPPAHRLLEIDPLWMKLYRRFKPAVNTDLHQRT